MWGCSGAGCPPDYRLSPRSCLSSITVGSTMWGSQPSRNCGARRNFERPRSALGYGAPAAEAILDGFFPAPEMVGVP